MHVAVLQQLAPNLLARAAFKQHVVRQYHGGLAVDLQHGVDVLQKIQLLVGRGFPEILALIGQRLAVFLTFLVGDGHAALLAKRRIRQHIVHLAAGLADQCVRALHQRLAVHLTDVVQEQVHQAHAARVRHDLVAVEGLVAQKGLLTLVQRRTRARQPAIGAEEKAAGTAGRVGNRLHGLRAHAGHHGLDQRTRREILAGAALGVFGVLLQQTLVQIAFGVGVQADPAFRVDHLHQARELGRILNAVLRLEEDRAQHALFQPQP